MPYFITDECNGCMLCSKLCPVSAISGKVKAVHIINAKRCVDCGVCGKACAKEAVMDANGQRVVKVPRKDWPQPVIKRELCSACAICVDACGKNALSISFPQKKGDLRVFALLTDEKTCVGCEICAKECPMQAITMEVPV